MMKRSIGLGVLMTALCLCASHSAFAQASLDYGSMRTVNVSNTAEFLAALNSNTKIIMEGGKYDFGQTPVIMSNLNNVEILGKEGTEVVVETGDECVFYVVFSNNIRFSGLTMGHDTLDFGTSFCPSAVLSISESQNISVDYSDIYGCGYTGFVSYNSQNITLDYTTIRDCSNNIAMILSSDVYFKHCSFYRNGYNREYKSGDRAFDVYSINDAVPKVVCTDCVFENNYNDVLIRDTFDWGGQEKPIESSFTNCVFNNNGWNKVSVTLNGIPVSFDQNPIIEDGRTLVPLRAIFEALGAVIDWDGDTQTVTSTKNGTVVKLKIGDNIMQKNDERIELDVPAKIVNERTLVPARAVAEAFGCKVDWNGDTQTVIITE
ncbi:MAG: stalk domain-containing protein [Candidatus Ornithomonoglobus sp.]